MVASASVQVSQSDVVAGLITGGPVDVSQFDFLTIINFPSGEVHVSSAETSYVSLTTTNVEVSQWDIAVVCRGRVDDPKIRVWTFTLDGHDFYLLRLGNDETLVYDVLTEQWSVWSTGSERYWTVYTGINWLGGNTFAATFGSNVVVGSDSTGDIYFLDPLKTADDSPRGDTIPFRRLLTGQLVARGYDSISVHEVQVLGSLNQGIAGTVDLLYSDDRGDNYVSAGPITTVVGDYDLRGHWQSLGGFSSPGRLFRLEDFGALARVDTFTVITSLKQE